MRYYTKLRISIMLPTRKRPDMLRKSIQSLIDTASSMDGIELLLAIDSDDEITRDFLNNELVPELNEKNIAMRAFTFERLGYKRLNEYSNYMSRESFGEWVILWNDDAIMKTKNWDKKIMKYSGQFKVLRFKDNHNEHPNSIFPCVPRDWICLFDTLSPHQVTDSWVSQIAYIAGVMQNCHEVYVHHDRFDLTGNNKDEVLQEREFLDNDPSNPDDLNHPTQLQLKLEWGKKLDWYLKSIKQSPGWLDQWLEDPNNFDLWSDFKKNDPNNQCFTSLKEREELFKNKTNLV